MLLMNLYQMLSQVFAAEHALHCSRSGATQLHRYNLGLAQQLVHVQQQLQASQIQVTAANEALTRANNRTTGLRTRKNQLQSEAASLRQRLETAEQRLAIVGEREQGRDQGTSAAPELQLHGAGSEDVPAQAQMPPPQAALAASGEADSASTTAQRNEAAPSGEETQPSSLSPVVSSPDDASGKQVGMEQASAAALPASVTSDEVDADSLTDLQASETANEVNAGRSSDLRAGAHDAVSATRSPSDGGSEPAGRSPSAELHSPRSEAAPADPIVPQAPLVRSEVGQPAADGEPVEAPRAADSNPQAVEQAPAAPISPQPRLVQSADGQPAADGEPVESSSSADSNAQALEQVSESTAGDGVALINEGTDAQLQHGAGARRRRRRAQHDEQQCSSVTARSREADPRWACRGWLQATVSMARVIQRRCISKTAIGQRQPPPPLCR